MLLSAPRDPAIVDGDAFWVERRIVSRALLDKGDAKTAYKLAATHSAETSADIAEAEFHAGWYALEFLGDPNTARKHFLEIERVSEMPLSQSRAEYWLGRAAERAGNAAERQVRQDVLKQLASRLPFPAPDSLVEREIDRRLEDFARRLMDQRIDPRQANIDWKQGLGAEWRQYEQTFPLLAGSAIDQVSLECHHSRVPIELIGLLAGKDVLVGAIDVASTAIETPDEVAQTLRRALAFVAPEHLYPCTNCGMVPLSRDVAEGKLRALAAGAALVRAELAASTRP